jgi:2-polyprenyl-3-methyl-5-hydroxy-6-metoxy-1,4-benzoquinol methylase
MFGLPGTFEIWKCLSCGVFSTLPKLDKRQLSLYYPSKTYYSYREKGNAVFPRLRRYLIDQFYHPSLWSKILFIFINTIPAIPQLHKHGKIIDIGCGNGDTLRSLKKYGWDVYGIDIDSQAIAYAKKTGLAHVRVGNHETLAKYPDNFFDVIRSYHVIEHMDDPGLFLELSYKKLKKGGTFICGTPSGVSIQSRIFKSYWYNLDAPRHQYIFTPNSLRQLLLRKKFFVVDLRFCSGGGFLGSIQYIISHVIKKNIDLVNNPFLFFLFYPLNLLSDKIGVGDVFVISAIKK